MLLLGEHEGVPKGGAATVVAVVEEAAGGVLQIISSCPLRSLVYLA